MSRLAVGRALGVLSQLSGIALLLVSSWLIVRAAQQPPVLYLMVAIVSVRFFGLARAALRYVERLLTHDAAFALVTEARVDVYTDLDRVAPAGMLGQRRGDLVSRVVSDVDALSDRVLRLRTPWIVSVCSTIAVTVAVALIDVRSGVVVAVCAGVAMLLVRVVVPRAGRAYDVAALRGALAAEVSQAVLASADLVAHGATRKVVSDVGSSVRQLARIQRRGAWVSGLGSAVVLVSTGISMALVASASGGLNPVLVGVAVLAPLALAEPLDALADAERLRPDIESARRRLVELADVPDPVVEPAHPRDVPVGNDLRVDDLTVGWDVPVASGISFDVPAGTAIAVTGPSGCGKSTLGLTLARLLQPVAGRVLLGGVPITDLRATEVRSRIGLLGQDEIVFDTSIRENLRIARTDATEEAMTEALTSAGLADFVAGLPQGLATPVGEHGNRLSGGERQRLCLARLLLADHRVLVLDEPTEHLDHEQAEALVDDLLALLPGRSIIVMTHAAWLRDRIGAEVRLGRDRMGGEATPGLAAFAGTRPVKV